MIPINLFLWDVHSAFSYFYLVSWGKGAVQSMQSAGRPPFSTLFILIVIEIRFNNGIEIPFYNITVNVLHTIVNNIMASWGICWRHVLVCLPQYLRPWLLLRVFLPNFKAPSLPYLRHGNELTDIIVSLEHSSQFLRSGLLYYNGEELFQWESWKDHEIKISSIAPMKNCLSGTKQILCLPEFALFCWDCMMIPQI